MRKDVALGSYYPVSSPIHKLNPCIKLVLFITIAVMIFVIKNFYGFLLMGGLLLVVILFSKVPISSVLKSLRAILFLIIFTFLLNILLSGRGGEVLFKIGKLKIKKQVLFFACFMALRLISLAISSAVLTLTTTPIELTDGLEVLLKPLTYIKFPVHALALIMSIALRFIPTLSEKTEQIMSAQKARGSEIESGNFVKKIKSLVPIIIPLLIASFSIADQLGDAMDSRCYNGSKKRTKYKKMTIHFKDVLAFFVVCGVICGIIVLNKIMGGLL